MCLINSLLLYLLPHAIYWSKTLLFSARLLEILLDCSGDFIWSPEVGLRSFAKANLQSCHKIVLPTSDKIRRLLMRRMNANLKTMAQALKSCCFWVQWPWGKSRPTPLNHTPQLKMKKLLFNCHLQAWGNQITL